jgi:hypothetical protein
MEEFLLKLRKGLFRMTTYFTTLVHIIQLLINDTEHLMLSRQDTYLIACCLIYNF